MARLISTDTDTAVPVSYTHLNAVHNAVVLEEVAKMACRTEILNARVQPAPQVIQDKHFLRKHGANAYYGQIKR